MKGTRKSPPDSFLVKRPTMKMDELVDEVASTFGVTRATALRLALEAGLRGVTSGQVDVNEEML